MLLSDVGSDLEYVQFGFMAEKNNNSLPENQRFVRLLLKHQQKLFSFILAMHPNISDAEDIFQETASVLLKKFSQFKEGTNFLAWSCKIARFEVLKYREKKTNRIVKLSDEAMQQLQRHYDEIVSSVDDRLKALENCTRKLSENDQHLLNMKYEEGCKIKDIAERIGRPVGGMYKVMSRIHNNLRLCVDRTLRAWQMESI